MRNESEQPSLLSLGVAVALTKQYTADQRVFLESLTMILQNAFPQSVKIKHKGFFSKKIQSVTLISGEHAYTLEDPGSGSLRSMRSRIVRGVAIRSEELPVEAWLQELGAALEAEAKMSAAVREALSKLA